MLLLGFSTADVSQAKSVNVSPMTPYISYYTGNITIEPNGTLHGSTPGSLPLVKSGNDYYLFGGIDGTLTVLYSGAVVNGENYSVSPVYGSTVAAITLENASHVHIMNFNLTSGGPLYGVLLNNTSNDLVDYISVQNYEVSFQILNFTHDVNISNSNAAGSYAIMAIGGTLSGPPTSLMSTSSNITVYNLTSGFSLGGIFVAAQYTKIIDSNISGFLAGGIFLQSVDCGGPGIASGQAAALQR